MTYIGGRPWKRQPRKSGKEVFNLPDACSSRPSVNGPGFLARGQQPGHSAGGRLRLILHSVFVVSPRVGECQNDSATTNSRLRLALSHSAAGSRIGRIPTTPFC